MLDNTEDVGNLAYFQFGAGLGCESRARDTERHESKQAKSREHEFGEEHLC